MFETKGNTLYAGPHAIQDIVLAYGEPLYLYDGDAIVAKVRQLRHLLPGIQLLYSAKANPNASILALLNRLVDGLDASSAREIQVAHKAGFGLEKVYFVGPSKSQEDLKMALDLNIGAVVVESASELSLLNQLAGERGRRVRVLVRINPRFDSSGAKLRMGGGGRQFGIDEEEIPAILQNMSKLPHLTMVGIHVYVGTRILDWSQAANNAMETLGLASRICEQLGHPLEIVNVGGGLGVPYFPGEADFDLTAFAEQLRTHTASFLSLYPTTRVLMELGRFLVGEAGIYITKVRFVKRSRGVTYVMTSGGMNHHQATTSVGSLLRHHFPISVLTKMNVPATDEVVVCGPLCTPNDVLGRSVLLPAIVEGDLIGILKSGAYGFTASPLEFLSHQWPAEVLSLGEKVFLIRRPPSLEEILSYQPLLTIDPCFNS